LLIVFASTSAINSTSWVGWNLRFASEVLVVAEEVGFAGLLIFSWSLLTWLYFRRV